MPVHFSDDPDIEEEAFSLVDRVIEKAVHDVSIEIRHNLANIPILYEDKEDFGIQNSEWSSCEKFTPDGGTQQIERFVATWKRDSAWLYCIDYMGEVEHDYDVRHKYRTLPVEVFYIFEGNRLVHKPGKSRFREIWLKNIIESKILMMDTITF